MCLRKVRLLVIRPYGHDVCLLCGLRRETNNSGTVIVSQGQDVAYETFDRPEGREPSPCPWFEGWLSPLEAN